MLAAADVDDEYDEIIVEPRRPQPDIRRPALDHRPSLLRRHINTEYLTAEQRRARGHLLPARPERGSLPGPRSPVLLPVSDTDSPNSIPEEEQPPRNLINRDSNHRNQPEQRYPSRDQPVTDLPNPHPEYTALEDSRRELRAFRTQNQALRNEVAELTRNLVTREQEWREEQNRLIARLNTRQNELDSAARQIDTLRATIGNHRTASAADRSHLRAHQNIARYGTHTHPINPEILESESEDDTPPRSRPRHHH